MERTRWQIGPLRIFPALELKDVGYDGNVYYQREDEEPISDFTTTISPEVKVYLLFRNSLILSLTENPEYIYYLEQKRERRWNNTFAADFRLLFLNRFVISGGFSNLDRRWRASSEFDVRANELRKSLEGSLFYETARRTTFGFSVFSEKISYEDIVSPEEEIYLSRDLNREENSVNVEFYYRIYSEASIFIKGGYTEYNFEYPESQWRDSYSYQMYSGLRFPLLAKIRGTFSLGYKKHVPLSEEKKGFSGLIGNTRLEFRLGRFNFRLKYSRDNQFSYWTESIFFIEDNYGTGVSFYLFKFLRLDGDYSYGIADYPETTTVIYPDGSVEEIKRKDIYTTYSLGFVVRIIENTGIGLKVNFWERDSNYYLKDRNRVSVGAYVTYEF
ncbi:MAG: outer membrane beta-barrel protein [Candidatus Hodarchaeota archaeon]